MIPGVRSLRGGESKTRVSGGPLGFDYALVVHVPVCVIGGGGGGGS